MRGPIITLTTDFGTVDGYAGAAKGVILSICPEARLVDITHQIPPQNVVAAAEALRAAVPWYPADAIHLAVIDPGVGGLRRPLALRSPDWTLVGPDNGVFSPLWRAALERHGPEAVHAVHLTAARFFLPRISATFHGRDLFAPVAAHLASGADFGDLGPPVSDLVQLAPPEPRTGDGWIEGEVIHVDRFGNCITNIPADLLVRCGLATGLRIQAADLDFGPLHGTYSEVAEGQRVALVDSAGRLELALREGNLSADSGIGPGTAVRVEQT